MWSVAFDSQTAHSRQLLAFVMIKVHVPYVTTLVRLDSGPKLESLPDRMSVYDERTVGLDAWVSSLRGLT